MHHLHEVPSAVRSTMEITLLGCATDFLAPRRTWYVFANARSQAGENGIEVLDYAFLATNHHTIASFQTPDSAACAHIYVMDALQGEFPGAPEVVYVVRIAAVDKDVLAFE